MNEEKIKLIKQMYAKQATNTELELFLSICKKYDLDPTLKQIHFQKYRNKKTGEMTATTYITRNGYLANAQRQEDFEGMLSFAIYENDIFEIDAQNYKITHKFGIKNRGKLIGAWAQVNRKGKKPTIFYVPLAEYFVDNPVWKSNPSAMIIKVAEANALRRAYSITGAYTPEELPIEKLGTPIEQHLPEKLEIEQLPERIEKEEIKIQPESKKILSIPLFSKNEEEKEKVIAPQKPTEPQTIGENNSKKTISLKKITVKNEKKPKTFEEELERIEHEVKENENLFSKYYFSDTAKSRMENDFPLFTLRFLVANTDYADSIEEMFEKSLKNKDRKETLLKVYIDSIEDGLLKQFSNDSLKASEIYEKILSDFKQKMEEYIVKLDIACEIFMIAKYLSLDKFLEKIAQDLNIPEKYASWGVKILLNKGSIKTKGNNVYPAE